SIYLILSPCKFVRLAMTNHLGFTLFPYTPLFRSWSIDTAISLIAAEAPAISCAWCSDASARCMAVAWVSWAAPATCTAVRLMVRSEEHTSELQSRENLVCRLLLEKKKITRYPYVI